jgi:hypothetical protein
LVERADLTGYGHPTFFGRKGLDGHSLSVPALNWTHKDF